MTEGHTQDLIERVEAATGPDRELDALIAVAASKEPSARVAYMAGRRWYKKAGAGRIPFAGAFGNGAALGMIFQDRRYTASIDAAVTLVPDGFEWAYLDNRAIVRIPGSLTHEMGEGATPAIALCAASLKARAIP